MRASMRRPNAENVKVKVACADSAASASHRALRGPFGVARELRLVEIEHGVVHFLSPWNDRITGGLRGYRSPAARP